MSSRRWSRTIPIVVALATLATRAAGEEQGAWTQAPPMPTARSEMQAAVSEGMIYVPGGLGEDRALGAFERLDPAAGAWEPLPPLPVPVHHAGVAAAAGRIFVTGGYGDLRFVPLSAVWAYEPTSATWSRLPDLPEPRAGHALVALEDLLYVVGGIGPSADQVWRFDPVGERWLDPSAPLPSPREHLAAVAMDGRIWAIAGRWRDRGNVGTVQVYDPAEDTWADAPELPTPRSGLTAAVFDGRIHVLGGESLSSERTFAEHEVYDPASGAWHAAAPLESGRHGLASAAVAGRLFAIGGATRAGDGTFGSLTSRLDVWSGDEILGR